jgi:probable rRNA maturation factor
MTRGETPDLPYTEIATAILGRAYNLNIIFTDTATATRLNKDYKKHEGPANILSFPYSKTEGEIYLSLNQARIAAPKFSRSYSEHLTFLLIHGMLHLKGHVHGTAMEREEKNYMAKFHK